MSAVAALLGRLRPRPLRARHGSIGLDFALDALHMVQLERTVDGERRVSARASCRYPGSREALLADHRALRQVIGSALRSGGFDGRRVVAAMPSGNFRTLSLHYRSRGGTADGQVIADEMRERIDGELDDYVLDYLPIRSQAQDGEKLALVALSPRRSVMEMIESLNGAGLTVETLEIGPVAIRRLINASPDGGSQMTLILNTGRTASYLTMLAGRRLLLDKSVAFCEQRLLNALTRALDIDEDAVRAMVHRTGLHAGCGFTQRDHHEGETGIFNTLLEILKTEFLDLIEEIDRAFLYAAAQMRGGGEARICLLGALTRWPGTDRVLADLSHLPVTTHANPLLFCTDGAPDGAPELAVACGLALKGLSDDG